MPQITHICSACGQVFLEWAYRHYKRCPSCRKTRPFTKRQLRSFYIDQGKSAQCIADELGYTKRQVLYWLRKYEIERRTPIETRFPDRMQPTREMLYNYYWIQWKSYAEIAEIYEVDPTAIPYWFKKFDIPSRSVWGTRRKGKRVREPSKRELEELYLNQNLSTADIGAIYHMSAHSIGDRLKKFGIELRLPGYNQTRFECSDGHVVLSTFELRVDNWLSLHGLAHIYEPPLPFGGKADFLASDTYIEVWGIDHNERYSKRVSKKKRLYKKHGLPLISLYPVDVLKRLDKCLSPLLVSANGSGDRSA